MRMIEKYWSFENSKCFKTEMTELRAIINVKHAAWLAVPPVSWIPSGRSSRSLEVSAEKILYKVWRIDVYRNKYLVICYGTFRTTTAFRPLVEMRISELLKLYFSWAQIYGSCSLNWWKNGFKNCTQSYRKRFEKYRLASESTRFTYRKVLKWGDFYTRTE